MGTRLLVCPPTFFSIDFAGNPWMTRNVGSASADALRQWDRFIETLSVAADVEFVTMDAVPHAPDLVFTSNAALICDGLAVVSSLRHPQQRRAQSLFRQHLAKIGFATTYLRQTYFEGSGDALFDRVRPVLYAGYGWRSERSAVVQLQEIVGSRVMPLLLVDERFYHLDMALGPLASGHVMVYMDAFSPHAQTLLRRSIDPAYLIEIGVDDALAFACANVEIGDAVVMHSCTRRLRERLNHAGYRVFCTELSEFHKAGAGAKTLTLKLDDGPAAGAVAATA
ncbi:MAG: dimethylarginine dimethylaminohydrolase family protein [Candidatus Velthaea sp.]